MVSGRDPSGKLRSAGWLRRVPARELELNEAVKLKASRRGGSMEEIREASLAEAFLAIAAALDRLAVVAERWVDMQPGIFDPRDLQVEIEYEDD